MQAMIGHLGSKALNVEAARFPGTHGEDQSIQNSDDHGDAPSGPDARQRPDDSLVAILKRGTQFAQQS